MKVVSLEIVDWRHPQTSRAAGAGGEEEESCQMVDAEAFPLNHPAGKICGVHWKTGTPTLYCGCCFSAKLSSCSSS